MPLWGFRSRLSVCLSLSLSPIYISLYIYIYLSLSLSLSLSRSRSRPRSLARSPLSLSLSLSLFFVLSRSRLLRACDWGSVGSRATHFFLTHGANRTLIFKKTPFCGHIGVSLACALWYVEIFADLCVLDTSECWNFQDVCASCVQKCWNFQDCLCFGHLEMSRVFGVWGA